MSIRLQVWATLLVLAAGVAAALLTHPARPPATKASDSLLCVESTTQDIEGTRIITPTICIPFI